jgi:hypothetical protein
MFTTMKRVSITFLYGIMVMFAAASTALAQTSGTTGDLTWELDETTGTLIITGEGAMPDYEYNGSPWYHLRYSITGAVIGNSVTSIGIYAFQSCSELTFVTFGNSVTSIRDNAFYFCSELTSVTIPNSVTLIGDNAFQGCSGLTSINVVQDNPSYSSEDGVLFNKDKTALIVCPGAKTGEYAIPNSVTSIRDNAFYFCSGLTSVTIPNSVTSIGNDAFQLCTGLASVTIPNSVTTIGDDAFSGCLGLTSVTIPNSVTSIGSYAFSGCNSLTNVTNLAETPQAIYYSYVFYNVNLSACTLYVPEGSLALYQAADVWKYFGAIEGITVGISDNTLANITVYSSGNSICIVNKSNAFIKSVQITDVQGRIVYDGRGRKFSTPAEVIPVNGTSGIYVVRIVSDDGRVLSTKVHLN